MVRCAAAWRTVAALGLMAMAACGRSEQPAATEAPLPKLPLDPAAVTVSGISAGGYMAVQFHVAHSALVQGAGIIAAGPYYCAEGSMRHALGRCMQGNEEIPTDRLLETTSQLGLDGAIDPIAGLADDRVWIFHGAADPVVRAPVVDALEAYYRALVSPEQVTRIEHPEAGHTFPSRAAAASACATTESPFVGNCDFDGARTLLEHMFGPLDDDGESRPDSLAEFDQRPYAAAAGSNGLAERGWLYVPAACTAGAPAACRLHVVFHGCKQGASFVGDQFLRRSGYLETAEANRIVLLFPQVKPSFQPLNPNGCWDWWGYEGEAYATQAGPQVRAVRGMIADLLGEATAAR
jgi:poly(3-hydroxybutyrate) depolymerase